MERGVVRSQVSPRKKGFLGQMRKETIIPSGPIEQVRPHVVIPCYFEGITYTSIDSSDTFANVQYSGFPEILPDLIGKIGNFLSWTRHTYKIRKLALTASCPQ